MVISVSVMPVDTLSAIEGASIWIASVDMVLLPKQEFWEKRREKTARLRDSNWREKMVDWVWSHLQEKTESLPEGQEVRIEWGGI